VAYSNKRGTVTMTTNVEANWIEQEKALSRIVGARLTSVQFILNYLILGFDEKGALTTLVWPEILRESKRASFGTLGYRDELCSLIGEVVKKSTIDANETVSIGFENGAEIMTALRSYKGQGERAILTGPKHYLFVF
jgi:hypothetical protein